MHEGISLEDYRFFTERAAFFGSRFPFVPFHFPASDIREVGYDWSEEVFTDVDRFHCFASIFGSFTIREQMAVCFAFLKKIWKMKLSNFPCTRLASWTASGFFLNGVGNSLCYPFLFLPTRCFFFPENQN